jgi:hypothetical protein
VALATREEGLAVAARVVGGGGGGYGIGSLGSRRGRGEMIQIILPIRFE